MSVGVGVGALLGARGSGSGLDLDLLAGVHSVRIEREGYNPYTEDIDVQAGVTTSRDYVLKKHRGWGWYATRVTGVAVVAGGIVALVAGGGGDSAPPPEPLPAAPAPPPVPGR